MQVLSSTGKNTGKTQNARFYRFIHISIEILVFVMLVIFTTLLLRPLQDTIRRNMEELRDNLLNQAGHVLNREIVYSSIGPSVFGTLDIRNIQIRGSNGAPVMAVSRLRISYSLWELLRGNISESLRSIRIDRPLLTLDQERDADLLRFFAPSRKDSESEEEYETFPQLTGFFPETFRLRVRGGEWAVEAGPGAGRFRLDGLSFDADIREGRIRFQGRWNAGAVLTSILNQPAAISMAGRVNGECSTDLSGGSARVMIPSLSGDLFRFRPVTVNFTLEDHTLGIQKINDRSPFDLSMDYDLDSGDISGFFRCEDFSLQNLVSLTGSWKDYDQWLSLRTTGEVSFERKQPGGLRYSVDLAGAVPQNMPMGNGSFAISGSGDGGYARISRFVLRMPQGTIRYSGGLGFTPLAPEGYLSLSDLSLSGEEKINAEFSISTEGRNISFFGENLSVGKALLSAVDGSVVREEGGLSLAVSALCFRDIESYEDVRLSSLSFEGSMEYNPRHIRGSLKLDSFALLDIADIVRPFVKFAPVSGPAAGIFRDLAVTTEVFITTDLEHISYNIPRFITAYEGDQDIFALASLSGTDLRFEINEIRVFWGGGSAGASGYVDFSDPLDIFFSLNASYRELSYYFEGMILDRRSLSLQGSYGFNAYVNMTDFGVYSGYIEVSGLPIPMDEQYARLSFTSALYFNSPSLWSVDINYLELEDFKTPASSLSALRLSGRMDQDGALFPELVFDDQLGVMRGTLSASWEPRLTNPLVWGNVRDEAGLEIYSVEGGFQDNVLDLRLSVSKMQLTRFLKDAYKGVVSGEVRLSWDTDAADSFSVDMNLENLSAQIGDTPVSAAARLVMDGDECILREVRLNYAAFQMDMPFLRINRPDSQMVTEARLWGTLGQQDMDISLTMDFYFEPIRSWFKVKDAFNSLTGRIDVTAARFDALSAEVPFQIAFSKTDEFLSVSGGPGDMLRLQVSRGGNFYAGLSYPSPVRGSLTGSISSGTVDARGTDLYVDLASLWRFVPPRAQEIITLAGGFATASVQITGPVGDPEFFGTVRGYSVQLLVPQYVAAPIRPVPLTVTLEGNEMVFGPVSASVGNGGGIVSGWFRFDRWVPNTFNLDVTVLSEDAIPFNMDIMGILAHGDVSGTLGMSMEDYVFTVSGDLTAQDTEISLASSELFTDRSFAPRTQVSTAADITITSGRKVEFVWPVTEFPVLQAYADLGTVLKISSDSLTQRYSVTGDINLRGGEIFYAERSFYIRAGTLSFNENEIQFEPRINARAEIRDRTDSGPVTISMIIDNAPLRSFTPRLESNPALSQIEILSLLGQNLTGVPEESTGAVQRAFLNSTTDILAQFSVVRRLERRIRDFFSLDLFSFRTQVLQNAIIRATGLQGPVDRIGGVGNYFDNTTVFVGKYIGANMFAQGMLSFRYDENRRSSGWLTYGGLILEPDIGIELRSPHFSIRWNVVFLHPENLFIDDNSFTLTWRWSF
jgi:hypothetical protein